MAEYWLHSFSHFYWPRPGCALWPVPPNFCSQATRKSLLFHRNHLLDTLDFTSSEYWAAFNFSWSHPAILTSHLVNKAYQYLLQFYGWIRERARWSKSCVLIGYSSGQTNQACLVKIAGYWPCKKEFGQYPAILTECWSITHNHL